MATLNAKSDYLEQKIIEAVLKATAFVGGASTFVALFLDSAPPTEVGGGTEVTGGAYARQAINAATGWSAGGQVSGGFEVSNVADVAYPVATANWGTIGYFALFDLVSGGNMLYYGQLDATKIVNLGDQFKFLIGTLKVAEL